MNEFSSTMTESRDEWRGRVRVGLGVSAAVASLAALIVVAITGSWSPQAWAASAAWVTVAIAVVGGLIAVCHLGEARSLRLQQAQPYVAIFIDHDVAVDPRFADLVVRNFGTTAAHKVRVETHPTPQRATAGEGFREVWLPDCIPVLVPRQEWRTLWDFAPTRAENELPDRHEATVCFEDSQAKPFRYSYILDWGAYRNRMHVTTYGMHHVAEALREIDQKLSSWQESAYGGLAVTVRDGDAKDELQRKELDS